MAFRSNFKRGFPVVRFFSTHSRQGGFGIAFDIDGVLIRGSKPLAGATRAIARLFNAEGDARVPFMLFTNGGGFPEKKKAMELSTLIGAKISSNQVFMSHTPFRALASCYRNKRTLAVGKGEPAIVLQEYGFTNVVAMDDYVQGFAGIDPLEQYKTWMKSALPTLNKEHQGNIEAVFVVSDPVDWGRDIQVISDVLNGGGSPVRVGSTPPPLYFAADDLIYQSLFPVPRYGMGAFRIALESVYNRLTGGEMRYTAYGKPNPEPYQHVQKELELLAGSENGPLETIYMIGDNPSTDIRGAKQAGKPWFSILVRTGCFRGEGNDKHFPADQVVDDVEAAIDFIFEREGI